MYLLKILQFETSLFPMDRKQLVTIAITAVTSVIAREVIIWLVALVKSTAQTQVAKEKARTIFNTNNLRTLGNVAFVAFTALVLRSTLRETTPLTRSDVALIVVSVGNLGVALSWLGFNVFSRIHENKFRKLRMMHLPVPVPSGLPSVVSTGDSQPTPDTPIAYRQLP
jgi:hypothetical protein